MSAPPDPQWVDQWLEYARADQASAKRLLEDPAIPAHSAAFHVQQAAETALKAVLIHEGMDPPLPRPE